MDHLIASLEEVYTMTLDMEGKKYIGLDLDWDCIAQTVTLSMDGYVIIALAELKHLAPKQHYYDPSKMEHPDYGAKIQYVKEDTTAKLSPALINYVQRVVGKFLYLGRAIDNTTLHALNEIAIATVNGTSNSRRSGVFPKLHGLDLTPCS